jgi:hypothetical protein
MQRPLPSMLIRTPAAFSTPVNGKLGTLVAVDDLRSTVNGQGFLERLDAEGRVHCIGQPPTQRAPDRIAKLPFEPFVVFDRPLPRGGVTVTRRRR